MQPNFLCIGTQKAGTTTLHDILIQHPEVYLPESKEAHFFDINEHYERGLKWWVDTFFSSVRSETIIGAMTPEYLYYEEVPLRILETLGPNIKIIVLLRNPVDRAFSHYLMTKRRGFENYSFKEATHLEKDRIKDGEFERSHFSYTSRGMYCEQVKRYRNIFPKENILVVRFEDDLLDNRQATISKILNFLELDDMPLNVNMKSNKATQARFKRLSSLIYKDSNLKKILRYFIKSSTIKIKINTYLDSLNQTTKNISTLTDDEKNYYLNKYFINDIKALEDLLKIDLERWYI